MSASLFVLLAVSIVSFLALKRKVEAIESFGYRLPAARHYYFWYGALYVFIPGAFVLLLWIILEPVVMGQLALKNVPEAIFTQYDPQLILSYIQSGRSPEELDEATRRIFDSALANYASMQQSKGFLQLSLIIVISAITSIGAYFKLTPNFNSRKNFEQLISFVLVLCSSIAVLTTIGIVISLFVESWRFFQKEPLLDVIFGTHWSPQTAIRADQIGSSGSFGFLPLLWGTLYITIVALLVAVPLGLVMAVFLSEYQPPGIRKYLKPAVELLAGIPTIVYGFLAVKTVSPLFKTAANGVGLTMEYESILVAGVVMGVMIIPFVSSLSEDVISSVPRNLRDASIALGSSQFETTVKVVLPAAFSGIVGSILLAFSRAIGETMIVVLAAGLSANFTLNPLESVTTITVQIVTILVGDQEFSSSKTLSAFGLGLGLFFLTLVINIISSMIIRKYQKNYD